MSYANDVSRVYSERFGVEYSLVQQIEQLKWEAEIREKELDRVIEENKICRELISTVRKIVLTPKIHFDYKCMEIDSPLHMRYTDEI